MKFFALFKTLFFLKKKSGFKVFIFLFFVPFYTTLKAQPAAMAKLSVLLLLRQEAGSQNTADGLVAVFANNFSKTIGNEDSYKFTNFDENIAIYRNGKNLCIEGRPTITASDTLPLRMWKFRQKNYYLKIDATNFSTGLTAVVKDAFLNTETPINLTSSTTLAFNITDAPASYDPFRFTILLRTADDNARNLLPVTLTKVSASNKEKGILVEWTAVNEINIDGYEIERSANGREFTMAASLNARAGNTNTLRYNWLDQNPVIGNNFYRIKVVEKSGLAKYSEVVKVYSKTEMPNVTVYPNPATGNTINVRINLEKGPYTISLYNNNGTKVYSRVIEHLGASSTQTISFDKSVKGLHVLKLNNQTTVSASTVLFK